MNFRQLLLAAIFPASHDSTRNGFYFLKSMSALTSQFENHLRAILGMPLGSTATVGFSAMLNLIGELPEAEEVLRVSNTHLHLYGKSTRPGRKLGHVTVRADNFEKLQQRLAELPAFFQRQEFCLQQAQSATVVDRA